MQARPATGGDGGSAALAPRPPAGVPHPALERLAALAARALGTSSARTELTEDAAPTGAGASAGLLAPVDELLTATARGAGALAVADTRADARWAALPAVVSGVVGCYLGVPMIGTDGQVVGVLAVFDPLPRRWSRTDVELLVDLAAVAVGELQLSALAVQHEADRLRWRLGVAAGGVGSFDLDLATGLVTWDERMLEMFGYTAAEFDGTLAAFDARVHPDDLPRVHEAVTAAVEGPAAFQAEYRVLLPSGTTRWVKARGEVLRDEAGRALRLVGAAYDTTAEKRGDARVSRLLESMPSAFYSLDRDWRFSHVNAEAERLLQRPREELLDGDAWELFPEVTGTVFEERFRHAVATGEPVMFEAHFAPLQAWFEVRAWPDPDGLSVYFLDVSARRAAQEEAERTARRLELLATVSADLVATLDADAAVARLARHVVPALARWAVVTLVDDSGALRDIGSWHADPDLRELTDRYRRVRQAGLAAEAPLRRSQARQGAVVIESRAAERLSSVLSDEARELLLQLAPESAYVMPLRARGRLLGMMSLFRSAEDGPLSADDLATAVQVADRAGLALDNASLYARQQHVAEGLQRSLLSAPVEPDHLEVRVRYRPAARAVQVGGDWYDSFLQPDGDTVLVIGDVMGHDVDAAAAMSQVRNLLRGIAYSSGGSPAAVLATLDAAMRGLAVATTATAVVARLEQTADERARGVTRLRWSNAGHPPPVLLRRDGTVSDLDGEEPDLLLGIAPHLSRRDEQVELERGSTVLLFTDGLVERRGQDIDEGLDLLREVVAELAGARLDDLCDGILDRLLPPEPEDDVALVAVRLHPQDGPRPEVAGPHRVPDDLPLPGR
ncbi:SpoIIE family protein phosphatase, partial [Paenibacillus sp. TRM 82003]|uniref:SpoIIE family protein phosphatase n=1 Tax=Kineococcus sp. TRM81007 TaxID=2925831 RepID=UPI001F574A83|nr:SpoIIE family protein phosphatase [Kineococcus sp. TRM81007]MCI2237816.1 SpoIIE family protein phosphatase [Kineococcus sp. TRM81007]MCI3926657.1 SpoIIE family protein phosphatase [Paenibacillus sp. TRM 82003]